MPSSHSGAGTVAALERAKTYPYDIPECCYALAGGGALRLVGVDLTSVLDCEVLDDGRVTSLRNWARRRGVDTEDLGAPELLLAYGSNASVAGLSRKLAEGLHGCLIPVARATLADFEVVYSAHLSSYGAVPATLQHSPGARTNVSVLLTTPAERRLLRGTEPNYDFGELDAVELRLELGPTLSTVSAVVSRHGALTLDGSEVGLAAVASTNRRFPARTQTQVLSAVRDLAAPAVDLGDFILGNVRDPELARRRTEQLKATARPFAYRSWRVVDPT
jgi:hypothetical protein